MDYLIKKLIILWKLNSTLEMNRIFFAAIPLRLCVHTIPNQMKTQLFALLIEMRLGIARRVLFTVKIYCHHVFSLLFSDFVLSRFDKWICGGASKWNFRFQIRNSIGCLRFKHLNLQIAIA
jgi:hypothetical protein